MAQWHIETDEYLKRLDLDKDSLERKMQLPEIDKIAQIIPLRELKEVRSVVPINSGLLQYLIRRIKTLDGQMPFINATIHQEVVNPSQLKIGQKYVYRENYAKILESMTDIFHSFMGEWGGLGNLGAYFVFGLNGDGNYSMACYIPPIIEIHGKKALIMDGIHRNYIARPFGVTINALIVKNIAVPFPCSPRNWKEISVISLDNKPKDLEERYFDLNKGLFRDLKYLGIDG